MSQSTTRQLTPQVRELLVCYYDIFEHSMYIYIMC